MKALNDKDWHEEVCKRDSYTCRVCKKVFIYPHYFDENGRNQYVCGHHRLTKASRPDLRLDIDNGVCLCFDCHEKVHRGNIKL